MKDPIGITGWPKEKGRDGERTPMQWDSTANAGFTNNGVATWLPVPESASAINVETEKNNPDSLLAWYKALIHLKKTNAVMASGTNIMLDTNNNKVLSWMREVPGKPTVVISANFTAQPQHAMLTIPGATRKLGMLLASPGTSKPSSIGNITLPPYGVLICEVE